MTYVVVDACIKCKYMDCIEVCPVECIIVDPRHTESEELLLARYHLLMAHKDTANG